MDNIMTIYSGTSFFDWLLANKEERKIIKFAKEMAKAINLDLKEIARNNECANSNLHQIGNTKLIIKGGHTEKWRVYFVFSFSKLCLCCIPLDYRHYIYF